MEGQETTNNEKLSTLLNAGPKPDSETPGNDSIMSTVIPEEGKNFEIKDDKNAIFNLLLREEKDEIFIQAFDKENIEQNDYKISLTKEDFENIDDIFFACKNLHKIVSLLVYTCKDNRISLKKEPEKIILILKLRNMDEEGFHEAYISLPQIPLDNQQLFIRFFDKINKINPFIKELEDYKKNYNKLIEFFQDEKNINEFKKLSENLTQINKLIKNLENNLNNSATQISENNKRIDEINKNKIAPLNKKTDEISNKLNNLKIGELTQKITALENQNNEQKKIIDDLNKKLNYAQNNLKGIGENKNNIGGIQNQIKDFNKKFEDINNKINALNGLNGKIDEENKKIVALDGQIKEKMKIIDEINKKMPLLQKIDEILKNIGNMTNKENELQKSVDEINKKTAGIQSTIDNVNKSIGTININIENNKKTIEEIKNKLPK